MFLSRVPRAAFAASALGAVVSGRAFIAVLKVAPGTWASSRQGVVRALRTTPHLLEHSSIDTPITAERTPSSSVTTTAADTAPPITKAIPSTTPLNSLHLSQGAKMVPFAGYSMPLLYPPQTHISEHNWTREHASIFDVSHMVQHIFSGPGALAFLESLTPTDLSAQGPFKSTLSVLLAHPTGGIIDDTIITMQASQERFYVVTNAGCREKDLLYFREALRKWKESPTFKEKGEVVHEVLEDWGLIALQGPEAKDVLAEYLAHALPPQVEFNLDEVKFGTSFEASVPASEKVGERVTVHIARGGYTGEDGFEISIPPGPTTTESQIPHPKSSLPAAASSTVPVLNPTTYITNMLLRIGGKERIMMAGLAARDSLRLEAGMCLYGHDLNEDITPVEASLGWIVHKRRRADGLFPGGSVIQAQLAKDGTPPEKKRIGLDLGSGGAPAREGMNIVKLGEKGETEVVGHVTSGGPAISLGMKNIAMGYVRREYGQVGTVLGVDVRGNVREAKVVRMPFVPTKYWKGIKGKGVGGKGIKGKGVGGKGVGGKGVGGKGKVEAMIRDPSGEA